MLLTCLREAVQPVAISPFWKPSWSAGTRLAWSPPPLRRPPSCNARSSARNSPNSNWSRDIPAEAGAPNDSTGHLGTIEIVSVRDFMRHVSVLHDQIQQFRPDWVLVSSEDVSHTLLREAARCAAGQLIYIAHTPQFFPSARPAGIATKQPPPRFETLQPWWSLAR